MLRRGELFHFFAVSRAFGIGGIRTDIISNTTLQIAEADKNAVISFRRYGYQVLQCRLGIRAAVADTFCCHFQSAVGADACAYFSTCFRFIVYRRLADGGSIRGFGSERNVATVESTVAGDGIRAGMVGISFFQTGDGGGYLMFRIAVRNFGSVY